MAERQSSIRTPLGKARGLGSAKEGFGHWWMQRVSAVALLPLSLFWLCALKDIVNPDLAHFLQWIGRPEIAIAGILFVITSFYHATLGMQVVIEDYIHSEGSKIALLLLNKISFFFLGTACVCSILWLSFISYVHIG